METKRCTKCDKDKKINEFMFRNKKSDKLVPWCNECRKNYKNNYYKENIDKINVQDNSSRNDRLLRNRQFIWDYYKEHPCVDCGESNPIVLQFDHINGDKFKNISMLVGGRYSIEMIQKEIDKCVVRCGNCHLIKTALEQDWYKNILK